MTDTPSLATSIFGISIPDSRLAHAITEFVRGTENDLLFNHSSRVFFFGAIAGQQRGLTFDHELLYAAAMFHDIGLVLGVQQQQGSSFRG
ncbi:HD domain-containing protein [Acetobacteraceae bacterium KSS8]|uniref:HD domain-containing protein n=1 Tax=Endosaccharibacter trunci TaxID=2812733 RepID=A0ABT1W9D3_9PROT|nr:HD domain-containing protein [Acetobacteraceae bacterium KSS8]